MKSLEPSLPGESRAEYLARTCDHQWELHGGRGSGPCPIPVCSMCGTVKKTTYPDDKLKDLVKRFSEALLAKLIAAEIKYGWNNGWAKSDWETDCKRHLLEHVAKGDPLDVAAYAAFCWHHGWRTSQGGRTIEMNREQIIALIQEHYDHEPRDWPRHRGWDDGTGDIADMIIAAFQQAGGEMPPTVETCPKCGILADTMLHRFCAHRDCPTRAALSR